MNIIDADGNDEHDRMLQAARDTFPEWDIIETYGGFVAVPKGTVMIHGITVDDLVKKLRMR